MISNILLGCVIYLILFLLSRRLKYKYTYKIKFGKPIRIILDILFFPIIFIFILIATVRMLLDSIYSDDKDEKEEGL